MRATPQLCGNRSEIGHTNWSCDNAQLHSSLPPAVSAYTPATIHYRDGYLFYSVIGAVKDREGRTLTALHVHYVDVWNTLLQLEPTQRCGAIGTASPKILYAVECCDTPKARVVCALLRQMPRKCALLLSLLQSALRTQSSRAAPVVRSTAQHTCVLTGESDKLH